MSKLGLPQDATDEDRQKREAELAARREIYAFDFSFHGLPLCKGGLPAAENYDMNAMMLVGKLQHEARNNSLAFGYQPDHHKQSPEWTAMWGQSGAPDTYDNMLKDLPTPHIGNVYRTDWHFAYQRLAGTMPDYLERVRDRMPAKFPVSNSMYRAVVGDHDSLDRAIGEARLYMLDYAILEGVPTNEKPFRQYCWPAMALFSVQEQPNGRTMLMPVAIQLTQNAGAPIFTPKDGVAWDMAKIAVQTGDSQVHGMSKHFIVAHTSLNSVTMCTKRHLSESHPLFRLYEPHTRGTMATNFITASETVNPGGVTESLQAPTAEGIFVIADRTLDNLRLDTTSPDADFAARGVDDTDALPDYPFRDDSMGLWKATVEFVSAYIDLYYRSDADVIGDTELQAMVRDLRSPDGGRLGGAGNDGHVETKADLVKMSADFIDRATRYHHVQNYTVYSFMGLVANMPLACYGPGPDVVAHPKMKHLWAMLPPPAKALGQIEHYWLIENFVINKLGTYDTIDDPEAVALVAQFNARLAEVEQETRLRDIFRPISFPTLFPSRITASANV